MRRLLSPALGLLLVLAASAEPTAGQEVGDRVLLESTNAAGVPVHPGPDDNSYVRWTNGTVAEVSSTSSPRSWIQVEASGVFGWVVRSYATVIVEDEPEEEEDPGDEILTYAIGAWNLEHFKDGKERGFPENDPKRAVRGPTYAARTQSDFEQIAAAIENDLDVAVLMLSEISGRSGEATSVELERLVGILGPGWDYEIGRSGAAQRVAFVFDTDRARRDSCFEIAVPSERIQDGDIFFRDPLVCRFTFMVSGTPMNDLVAVALHLASGQRKDDNHDRAMEVLMDSLHLAQSDGRIPSGEMDVLIGGDLNATRYDTAVEDFWTDLDPAGWDIEALAPIDGTQYPGTRLAGVPLIPSSQIDYLMASTVSGGLSENLVQLIGHVRTDLLPNDFNEFREHFSDHLPVTVRVRVAADDDPPN